MKTSFLSVSESEMLKKEASKNGTYCTGDVHSLVHILFWYLLFSTIHVCLLVGESTDVLIHVMVDILQSFACMFFVY